MKRRSLIKKITVSSMLVAMGVVIGFFCKTYLNFGDGLFRITFENLPIILSGVAFGPIFGCVSGVLVDLISYLISGQTYPPNLVVMLGAALIGLVSGLSAKFLIRKRGNLQIILSGALAHLIGSMIVKPIGLYQYYQAAAFLRIPLYLAIAPIEILLICLLFKNGVFKRAIRQFDKELL